MIHIYFDNNAWQSLFASPDREQVFKQVRLLRDSQGLQLHFSFINFSERLLGLHEDSFVRVKEYLQLAGDFCVMRVLLPVVVHLRAANRTPPWYDAWDSGQLSTEGRTWTDLLLALLSCADFDTASGLIRPYKEWLQRYKSHDLESLSSIEIRMTEFRRKAKSRSQKAVLVEGEAQRMEFRAEQFIRKVRSLGLIKDGFAINEDEAVQISSMLPSVLYFVDAYIAYFCELFSGARHPESGDSLDLEQLIYLDRMDYFVTQEFDLRRWVDSSGNDGLSGRLITLQQFKNEVGKQVFYMAKRAPFPITEIVRF